MTYYIYIHTINIYTMHIHYVYTPCHVNIYIYTHVIYMGCAAQSKGVLSCDTAENLCICTGVFTANPKLYPLTPIDSAYPLCSNPCSSGV